LTYITVAATIGDFTNTIQITGSGAPATIGQNTNSITNKNGKVFFDSQTMEKYFIILHQDSYKIAAPLHILQKHQSL
jgi:hypothetical protein